VTESSGLGPLHTSSHGVKNWAWMIIPLIVSRDGPLAILLRTIHVGQRAEHSLSERAQIVHEFWSMQMKFETTG